MVLRSALLAALLTALSIPAASAETLRGTYVPVGPDQADIVEPTNHTSRVIFLNRCVGGCTIYPGYDDSRSDHSSIPWQQVEISEFRHGDATWDEVLRCVRRMYEPFDIVITDEDPGNAEHFEAIVAGTPGEAGLDDRIGGIAPGGCGIVNNSITFSFANATTDVGQICWTVAQETAHSFGLDHEFLCEDPMTYLSECGTDKAFQDVDARCGEQAARDCYCGGATQNSYQRILAHFGPGELTPPEVSFARPADGGVVRPGFPVEAAASDDVEVSRVELWVDGEMVAEATLSPFVFNAPEGLSGEVELELRAFDNRQSSASATISVTVDDSLRELGEPCVVHADCVEQLCAAGDDGEAMCTRACEVAADDCPGDLVCRDAGEGEGLCWSDTGPTTGGGCSLGGGRAGAAGLLWILIAVVAAARRRRD